MLKNTQSAANSDCHPVQKAYVQSPYKALENSPARKQPRPSLVIAEQLRSGVSQNKILNQDFCKRLQQIKRKYTSPSRATRTLPAPMAPIDLNIMPKKTIANQNSYKGKQQGIPTKNINKSIPDLPRPFCFYQGRQPLQGLSTNFQHSKQPIPMFDPAKGVTEEERINSINNINEKINNILEGISHKNGKFIDHTKFTEPSQHRLLDSALSARSKQVIEKRHLHTSLQKDHKPVSTNRQYLQTSTQGDKRCLTKQFDSKMAEIQQRIKKSEENRLKAMQSYRTKQTTTTAPSTHAPAVDKKPQQIEAKQQILNRQRVSSGMYSHKYMGFGKNKSRNILEQLKALSKEDVSETPPPDAPSINKSETRRLVNTLVEQIRLDEQLRNGKIWLQANPDTTKWAKLREILSRKEAKAYTQQEIKGIFKWTQDDQNPFFISPTNQSFQNIVNKHVDAEGHWKSKLYRKFDGKKLSQQGFKADVVDLQLKGYLQIEDIVRYLNIETGKFYRNRDLALIFKRVAKSSRVSFEDLLAVVQG